MFFDYCILQNCSIFALGALAAFGEIYCLWRLYCKLRSSALEAENPSTLGSCGFTSGYELMTPA